MKKVVFMSLLTLLISCGKDENTLTTSYYYVDPSTTPFLFNIGSYWIYQDSTTGSIDSIAVRSVNRYNASLDPKGPGQGTDVEEYAEVAYFGSGTGSYNEIFRQSYIFRGPLNKNGRPEGICYYGRAPYGTPLIGSTIYNATYEAIFDTLNVAGTTYHNVSKLRIHEDSYITNCNLYYVKNIGIVKKEYLVNDTVNRTENLIRYNLIQYPYP